MSVTWWAACSFDTLVHVLFLIWHTWTDHHFSGDVFSSVINGSVVLFFSTFSLRIGHRGNDWSSLESASV